jgi:hypothetical protein
MVPTFGEAADKRRSGHPRGQKLFYFVMSGLLGSTRSNVVIGAANSRNRLGTTSTGHCARAVHRAPKASHYPEKTSSPAPGRRATGNRKHCLKLGIPGDPRGMLARLSAALQGRPNGFATDWGGGVIETHGPVLLFSAEEKLKRLHPRIERILASRGHERRQRRSGTVWFRRASALPKQRCTFV